MDQQKIPADIVFTPDYFRGMVKTGIVMLDKKGPADWRQRVNLEALDLSRLNQCILGQLFGDYGQGLSGLGINIYQAVVCGFSAGICGRELLDAMYPGLTQCWKEELSPFAEA